MRQKAEYRSAKRSRNLIRQAYMELLQEKPLAKITVTDIAKRADINRGTFYAHYPDVRGVTEEIEREIIKEMLILLTKFECSHFFSHPTLLLLKISRFLEKDEDIYKVLIRSDNAGNFLEKLKQIFADHVLSDTDIPADLKNAKTVSIRINYFAGGIVNVYKQWFTGQLDCRLNDMALEIS
ncbi:MAG: TetR/AcrR family transcriptional regulator [Aerococcus sp.]|nr:TetR/AcrR family transcriptional regulator [Aerococcus sp.]